MRNTEEILHVKVQRKIEKIVEALKKHAAKQIRDELLAEMVQVKAETPKELQRNPKETVAQAKARRKKLEEWQSHICGAEFTYDLNHAFVLDIEEIINSEIGNYLHRIKS